MMNVYAEVLRRQGKYVINVDGVDWFDYNGFMVPAYLPHSTPPITRDTAREVLKVSKRPFARWNQGFGEVTKSDWWYILRRGTWRIEDIRNKKNRWMIRQGKKNFSVRPLTLDEVISDCSIVAQSATLRYKGEAANIETREILEERTQAAKEVPNAMEYIGCFACDTLVSYSENYIQDNAVWLANIRHDPSFLNKYSSYGLMDGLLDYYLNNKQMDYVLDGSRSIHHKTNFQEHLIKVFGFTKEYSVLNIIYSPAFGAAIGAVYPFKRIILNLADKWSNNTLDKIAGVLKQDCIRRSCEQSDHPLR